MSAAKRYCPVCRQFILPTTRANNICRHRDSTGRDVCPMSGEPYELAEIGRRRCVEVDRYGREEADAHDFVTTADRRRQRDNR